MMKLAPLLVPLLLLAIACDGGDSGADIAATVLPDTPGASPTADGVEATPTSTAEVEPTGTATEAPALTPTPTPEDGEPTTPAIEGTPATGPADLGPYEGMSLEQSPCTYDPVGAVADCRSYGLYSPAPAPSGQDITCSLFLVSGQPTLVFCRSAEPPQSTYYEIQ